ncbi:hypothetical protein EDC02_5608 [Micromonospora sp. Llam0]|uniref:hypothetical protein n=1 Tax=Micromonospora sp. Llam0 TaxID=2485143 RepID=UPI000F476120|nr:hypothetical protein [Micromonospora sp. Llam0]ROO50755.1 hypothetical protein EDC02_5608 [Micromonospora sp. Llam0]
MDHGHGRLELSIGYPTSRPTRLAVLSVLGVGLVTAGCCLGSLLGLVVAGGGDQPTLPVLLGTGLALAASAGIGLPIARVTRTGAWLSGTRLTVRGLATRTVDLRTAETVTISLGSPATTDAEPNSDTEPNNGRKPNNGTEPKSGGAASNPVLTVSGPDGTVRLPLRNREGTLLPAAEMIALARAFSAASCPGAHDAAHLLHTMDADPRALLL